MDKNISFFYNNPCFWLFQKLNQKIIMFAGSTFLSFLDRLSAKSLLTGRTGTCLGILGTISFIIISFILFIGPVIYYFQGDFIEGSFYRSKNQNLMSYTGCDFKMAVSFYQKATNQLANHTAIRGILDAKIIYYSPSGEIFYAPVKPCSPEYFAEMENKPHPFNPDDCVVAPDGIGYAAFSTSSISSVIGIAFIPQCEDPFVCTYASTASQKLVEQSLAFYQSHYMIFRFTSSYIDNFGNVRQKFYEMSSTQWQGEGSPISRVYAIMETSKNYLDNSIMPWYNNNSALIMKWMGRVGGYTNTLTSVLSFGAAGFIAVGPEQRIVFRNYVKLDWILGMLAGGILILFLIFWVPCHFISRTKQQMQICRSTILTREEIGNLNDIQKPKHGILWAISRILPFKLKYFKKQNKLVEYSEKFLDIADLVKKLKITAKNLRKHGHQPSYQPRLLEFGDEPETENYTETEIKYQLRTPILGQIKEDKKIPEIYSNHLPMLALCDYENNQNIKKRMSQIMEDEIYSKLKAPKFEAKEKSLPRRVCKKISQYLEKFFMFFDVFGAKPMFSGFPKSYSIFGCFLVLIICILSILLFSVTLKNMGAIRLHLDQIYVDPEQQYVKLSSGDDFRAAICFNASLFTNNLIISQFRAANLKFFQYFRNGTSQQYIYYDMIRLEENQAQSYFDIAGNVVYDGLDMTKCYLPPKGTKFQIYGDEHTKKQAYIGFKMAPYCSSTPSNCSANVNTTNQNFYNLLGFAPINILIPTVQYLPEKNSLQIIPIQTILSAGAGNYILQYKRPIRQTASLDTLELIDDWASWMMGSYPKPYKQTIGGSLEKTEVETQSLNVNSTPFYEFRFTINGNVQRVIFSSYKIDFLFTIIGGSFLFFYFFFGCFGKAYNLYQMKVKLAQQLYNEDNDNISGFRAFLTWLRLPCCNDKVLSKIESDIDCLNLAKNVDNVYRLSVAQYQTPLKKDLGLIYLKQRIKQDERVKVLHQEQYEQEDIDDDDDNFELDWFQARIRQQKMRSLNLNNIENISQSEQQNQIKLQKVHAEMINNLQKQSTADSGPITRSIEKCRNITSSFDLFHTNAELTLDGKRSVQSAFGGFCCIILFIFICVLTSHFLTVYFSDYHQVSQTKITELDPDKLNLNFNVGQNFKLAVSFFKPDNFNFQDISTFANNVAIRIIKYTSTRDKNGSLLSNQQQTIDLIQCPANYLNGFIGTHQSQNYFGDLSTSYCVPDGTKLSLYGTSKSQKRSYFSLKIYNKYKNTTNSIFGFNNVKQFLNTYIPVYHISNPIMDYRPGEKIHYNMISLPRSNLPLNLYSLQYNISVQKSYIRYDTAVNPRNEKPTVQTFNIDARINTQYVYQFQQVNDFSTQLMFTTKNYYNDILVKKLKVNDIFGIVGGCIVLLFFGVGAIPRSFNEYKLRYKIGTKLYTILGKKKHISIKNMKKKLIKTPNPEDLEPSELSEKKLLLAWFSSHWAFIKSNFNENNTLRLAALLESRASNDINIFKFMKTLHACQNTIKKLNLNEGKTNLCRVFAKHTVPLEERDRQVSKQLIENIKIYYPLLIDASRVNRFTQWELNILIKAKQKGIDAKQIFDQKWLDKFMGTNCSSRIQPNNSQTRFPAIRRSMNDQPSIQVQRINKSNAELSQGHEVFFEQKSSNIIHFQD